jgi:hypothetical protein
VDNPKNEKLMDLNGREFATFAPLIVLAVWMGLYPKPFLDRLDTSVARVIARVSPQYGQKLAECGQPPAATLAGGSTTPAVTLIAANNSATPFLSSLPCGPDGKPLTPGEQR